MIVEIPEFPPLPDLHRSGGPLNRRRCGYHSGCSPPWRRARCHRAYPLAAARVAFLLFREPLPELLEQAIKPRRTSVAVLRCGWRPAAKAQPVLGYLGLQAEQNFDTAKMLAEEFWS